MLSSDAGISSMPSSMISNISETEQCTNNNNQQEIVIRNNMDKTPMVVAPEHFTCQNDESLQKAEFCYAAPDVLEMKETQHESKVIWSTILFS